MTNIPKKLEFRPHLTTGVIARDRDMEMLVLWLNELRDYLQAKEEEMSSMLDIAEERGYWQGRKEDKEEANKLQARAVKHIENNQHEYEEIRGKCSCGREKESVYHIEASKGEKTYIFNGEAPKAKYISTYKDRVFPKDLDLDPDPDPDNTPASKGRCNCLCHFDRIPTKEEYVVSSYYGCEHCRSNPPEHEESWEKEIREDNWDTSQGIMTKQTILRRGERIGNSTTMLKVEMIINYIRDNFVSKEKIKTRYNRQRCAECNHIECKELDKFMESLGLGD